MIEFVKKWAETCFFWVLAVLTTVVGIALIISLILGYVGAVIYLFIHVGWWTTPVMILIGFIIVSGLHTLFEDF